MSRSILITGGAGFIGSNLAIHLKALHPTSKITVADSLTRRGSENNLPRLMNSGVRFCHVDVCSFDEVKSLPHSDVIIDCAADPAIGSGFDYRRKKQISTNLEGTVNTLEKAANDKADLIYISTSRVYSIDVLASLGYKADATRLVLIPPVGIRGICEGGIAEDFSISAPRSLYGASKLAGEILAEEYQQQFGIRVVINRCGIVAGPWQFGSSEQGVFSYWAISHLLNRPLQYVGFGGIGLQVRDVLHVQDLCELISCQIANINECAGNVFNVGGGIDNSFSLNELTVLCANASGHNVQVTGNPETRKGDIPWYVSDTSKVKKCLGWAPEKRVSHVLEDTIAWAREHSSVVERIFDSA